MAFSYYLLDGNFSKHTDFYDIDTNEAVIGTLPKLIKEFFAQLPADSPAAVFQPYEANMARELYTVAHNDFPYLNRDHQLQVAVLIEPGTFVVRDLLMFLHNIDFIALLPPTSTDTPDVIITTMTNTTLLASVYAGWRNDIPVIKWQNEASDNDFFRLYATLYDTLAAKSAKAAAALQPKKRTASAK